MIEVTIGSKNYGKESLDVENFGIFGHMKVVFK